MDASSPSAAPELGMETPSDFYISYANDTSSSFVCNLESCFHDKGFILSKDNLDEVQFHRYFIVVLSKKYPYSVVRLDELAKIMNTAEAKGVRVLPVFYDVNPSDIRHQRGDFGKALESHQNIVSPERFEGWRMAMIAIADIIGFPIKRGFGKDELEYIKEIYQNFSNHVACTVGLDRRAVEVMRFLNCGSDVQKCIVAICGVPGIGKSTVARRVHQCISKQFPYHHFADKAGEHLQNHGLETLLSNLAGDDNIDVKQNKFFLTLEDIDDLESLEAVIHLTNLLGCGSKVVITSKDYHFLERCGIERIYNVERFNNLEAYELLALKVLRSKRIEVRYVSIFKRAAEFASGLPLLLEVIGSHLVGKLKIECEPPLAEYKQIQGEETEEIPLMKKILLVSVDALEECPREKLIYIANLLEESKYLKEEVERNLHNVFTGCPKQDMNVLLDKSLMKINEDGEVIIHKLILDMVREIC